MKGNVISPPSPSLACSPLPNQCQPNTCSNSSPAPTPHIICSHQHRTSASAWPPPSNFTTMSFFSSTTSPSSPPFYHDNTLPFPLPYEDMDYHDSMPIFNVNLLPRSDDVHDLDCFLFPSTPLDCINLQDDSPHCLDSLLHLHKNEPISSLLFRPVRDSWTGCKDGACFPMTSAREGPKKEKLSLSDFGLSPVTKYNARFKRVYDTSKQKKAAHYHHKDNHQSIDVMENKANANCHASVLPLHTSSPNPINQDPDPKSIRRKQLTQHFYTLRCMLPNLLNGVSQNDRCHLIDKTCEYIKTLERKVRILRKKANIMDSAVKSREESDFGQTKMEVEEDKGQMDSPHVKIAYTNTGFINISVGCYERKRNLFPNLLSIIDKNQFDILSANQSRHQLATLYTIHVKVQQSRHLSKSQLDDLQQELQSEVTRLTM